MFKLDINNLSLDKLNKRNLLYIGVGIVLFLWILIIIGIVVPYSNLSFLGKNTNEYIKQVNPIVNNLTMQADVFAQNKLLVKELSDYFEPVDIGSLVKSLIPQGVDVQKIDVANERRLKYANVSDYDLWIEGSWENIILMMNNFENNKDSFFISEYSLDVKDNTKIVKGKIVLTRIGEFS